MKRIFLFLVIGLLLAVSYTVSADNLGQGNLAVTWSNPNYAGYYLDYDGTVSGSPNSTLIPNKFYEDIFCVSHDNANSSEIVNFFTIDSSLISMIGNANYEKISKAAWIADNWDTYTGFTAMDAQIAIWSVTDVVPTIQPFYYNNNVSFSTANAVTLKNNSLNFTNYTTDTYALAISGTYPGGSYNNGARNFQDYLVPMTPAPVPEPATMLLLGSGLVGLAGFGRKKLKK
jgi:hypothetical protein